MFLNHLFCWIFFFFICVLTPPPPEILPSENYRFLQKHSPNYLAQLENAQPLREGRGNGWTEKWRDEGWQEVSQLSRTQSRPSTLLSTNDQRPWIPAAPQGQQLLPSSASLQALNGRGISWAGYSPAKQSSNSGLGTDRLVVPAGWLSLLKPYPANYSLRMPSWLSNGESGEHMLLGPLTGLYR